jgi:uncharacterized protein
MYRWTILGLWLTFGAMTNGALAADASRLTIDTDRGPQSFSVELATTPDQQALGLMYRDSLAPDAGMLFVFASERQVDFWMKNTRIPLDMLFIGADGRIRHITERAVPYSETPIPSVEDVRAVLEINGGTVARLGIKEGDVVHDAALGT